MVQYLRLQDGKKLPVQVIADDCKKHRGYDDPFPFRWIFDLVHVERLTVLQK